MFKISVRSLFFSLLFPFLFILFESCNGKQTSKKGSSLLEKIESVIEDNRPDDSDIYTDKQATAMLVLPCSPAPGEEFRILATGGKNIRKAKISVTGPSGELKSLNSKTGEELPFWRIDDFAGIEAGTYKATLIANKKQVCAFEFEISVHNGSQRQGAVWKTIRGWDAITETIYSAWVNALFQGSDEQTSWSALHEVTRNKDHNFLYNYLSLGEDEPKGKNSVIMEPDCADNPFYLRAYFAWKLGLPFGYHVSDRGWVGHPPTTGQWVTNETSSSKTNPVLAFNSFIRRIMDGVHSGTARTAFDNENTDYYPIALDREALYPGTVYADPYGHTLILVSWKPQTKEHPGLLLSVDAQPDKTIAIKRFWKGNFLFNTSEVVGEPGFKAFRPITIENGKLRLMQNEALNASSGFAPYSLQQRKMECEAFYHTMDRLINQKPLDPGEALLDLIEALHEQLLVRVKSVSNGEAYFKTHPGSVISMPSGARGIFQSGGQWEDFSTPNRDLRLLIAMDAVVGFPDRVTQYPEDFNLSKLSSAEGIKEKLQSMLNKKVSELSISYTRTDGSTQELTIAEILKRRDAFEMAYNPNDGIEIRWGAPVNSDELATCRRRAPSNQHATMQAARKWFTQRLHPPT